MSRTVARCSPAAEPASRHQGVGLYTADGDRRYLHLAERRPALGAMGDLDPDKALAGAASPVGVPLHPTSASWLNAVDGFFSTLTRRRLQRGVFR